MKKLLVFAGPLVSKDEFEELIQFITGHNHDYEIKGVITACRSARMIKYVINQIGLDIPVGYMESKIELPLTGCEVSPPLVAIQAVTDGKRLARKILYEAQEKELSLVILFKTDHTNYFSQNLPGLLRSKVKEVHLLDECLHKEVHTLGRCLDTQFFLHSNIPILHNRI